MPIVPAPVKLLPFPVRWCAVSGFLRSHWCSGCFKLVSSPLTSHLLRSSARVLGFVAEQPVGFVGDETGWGNRGMPGLWGLAYPSLASTVSTWSWRTALPGTDWMSSSLWLVSSNHQISEPGIPLHTHTHTHTHWKQWNCYGLPPCSSGTLRLKTYLATCQTALPLLLPISLPDPTRSVEARPDKLKAGNSTSGLNEVNWTQDEQAWSEEHHFLFDPTPKDLS